MENFHEQVQKVKITGKVKKIIYHSPKTDSTYGVLVINCVETGENLTVVGNVKFLKEKQVAEFYGSWVNHPQHGLQFKVDYYTLPTSDNLPGLYEFLISINGFNKTISKAIIENFGSSFEKIIETTPEKLLDIPGFKEKHLEALKKAYFEEREYHQLTIFLEQNQLSPSYARKIYQFFGKKSIDIIRENPYCLVNYIEDIDFKKVDNIALKLGTQPDSPLRIQSGITYILEEEAYKEGHCFLPHPKLLAKVNKLLTLPNIYYHENSQTVQAIEYLTQEKKLFNNQQNIYLNHLWIAEKNIAQKVKELMSSPKKSGNVERWIREFEATYEIKLANEQKQAVIMAFQEPFMLLTGGAGCGKSLTAKAIYYIWTKEKRKIKTCAPTGRAAQRLKEAIGIDESYTIHRLLEYNGFDFLRNSDNPLECDAIIIDESTMINSLLLERLFQAIVPGTKVCMIGDPYQLPPIGPGTPFLILSQQTWIPKVNLTQIFRQSKSSSIIPHSTQIRNAQIPELTPLTEQDLETTDTFLYEVKQDQDIKPAILDLLNYYFPQLGFTKEKVQFLSPMNKTDLGNDEINKIIRSVWNPMGNNFHGLRIGDKVIQTVNNYELDIYNGDIGWVLSFDTEKESVCVKFDQIVVKIPKTCIPDLKLAYSISIHKAQGSEFPVVVMLLPTSHQLMLNRNLIYTGFTRAKEMLILIAAKRTLQISVAKECSQKRNTELDILLNS